MDTLLCFLVFGALFFFMMRFGCGAHVTGHGHGHGHHMHGDGGEHGPSHHSPAWQPPPQGTDPVCGMTVNPGEAKSSVFDGSVYYFCSEKCRLKFEDDPVPYLQGGPADQAMENSNGG